MPPLRTHSVPLHHPLFGITVAVLFHYSATHYILGFSFSWNAMMEPLQLSCPNAQGNLSKVAEILIGALLNRSQKRSLDMSLDRVVQRI